MRRIIGFMIFMVGLATLFNSFSGGSVMAMLTGGAMLFSTQPSFKPLGSLILTYTLIAGLLHGFSAGSLFFGIVGVAMLYDFESVADGQTDG